MGNIIQIVSGIAVCDTAVEIFYSVFTKTTCTYIRSSNQYNTNLSYIHNW